MPQSIAATRVALTPVASPRATHGPAAHQSGSSASASSPSGLTPGPAASACADEDVQALHPVGHAPCGDPVDLGHVADAVDRSAR